MTKLLSLTPRQAMSPLGLPEKQTVRFSMTLRSVSHPVLMRYLEAVVQGSQGDAIAAFAEEGIRAKLGLAFSQPSASSPVIQNDSLQVAQEETSTALPKPQTAATAEVVEPMTYDRETAAMMFPNLQIRFGSE